MTRRARNSKGGLLEQAFQTQVLNLAELYSWRAYHTKDSRGSQRGFPDLVLVRDQEIIFAELKTDEGRTRPEQAEWIAALENVSGGVRRAAIHSGLGPFYACVDVYLWRPANFDDMHARLARGRVQLPALYRDAA